MHIASFQVLVVLTRPKIAFGVPIKDYQNGSLTGAIRVIYARFYELGSVGGWCRRRRLRFQVEGLR